MSTETQTKVQAPFNKLGYTLKVSLIAFIAGAAVTLAIVLPHFAGRLGPLGHHNNEPIHFTLADYVDLVYLVPAESTEARTRLRTLAQPLIAAAKKEDAPDFIRVYRLVFLEIKQLVPEDATGAREKLSALAGGPPRGPGPAYRHAEWEEQYGRYLTDLPEDLRFLHDLPQRGRNTVWNGGGGNSVALHRATEYAKGERQRYQPGTRSVPEKSEKESIAEAERLFREFKTLYASKRESLKQPDQERFDRVAGQFERFKMQEAPPVDILEYVQRMLTQLKGAATDNIVPDPLPLKAPNKEAENP